MLLAKRAVWVLSVVATALCAVAVETGCSRSPLRLGDYEESDEPTGCRVDADCIGANACDVRKCIGGLCEHVLQMSCDDGNACTNDTCDPTNGSCSHGWVTPDDDGDGHRAALPGKTPGAPDACGDDCNDASPNAYPGAHEACDGVDNDCNGIIDDRYQYYSDQDEIPPSYLVSTSSLHEAMPGGLAYDGNEFAMTVVERNERWQGVFHALAIDGTTKVEATALTLPTNDSVAGPLIWTGSLFGTAWEDRRDTSYDIYFNRLDGLGKKLAPDLRVTSSDGFSVEPSLTYNGVEWQLAYADDQGTNQFSIFTQRISRDAELLGASNQITPPSIDARQPRLIKNATGVGLFYYSTVNHRYWYVTLDSELRASTVATSLPFDGPADATIRWSGDRYIVAFSPMTSEAATSIWAMSVDANGQTIDGPRIVTYGASIARSPAVVAMGDRFVLLWADDLFSPGFFELSLQMFYNDLTPIDRQQQITALGSDSIDPIGVLGGGSLGVMYRSRLYGPWETFFLGLRCWYVTGGLN